MTFQEVLATLGLPLGTYIVSLASGFIPIINIEAFLVGVALLAPDAHPWAIVLLATAGQMTAKTVMYFGGQGLLKLPEKYKNARIERMRAKLSQKTTGLTWTMFLSASVGLPPLYLMSIVAGSVRFGLLKFLLIGSLGRTIRFALMVFGPQLFRRLSGS